ncbi:MAG TPA: hypothetical protein VFV51_16645 [Vicinamibacterales bacterium]|nr:hypothetical protein [Vicinamibacterales bacterium]
MIRKRLIGAAIVVACGLIAAPAAAQSLADVARQEEARRKTAKKAVKSFSNADLAPAALDSTAPAAAASPTAAATAADCIMSASQGKCVPAEEVVAKSQGEPTQADPQVKMTEATVRQRASAARQRLEKARQEFNTLSTTADDQSRSPGERAAAARLASQRESMLSSIERGWLALEKEVADQGLPREWLHPIPTLSTRTPQ